MGVWGGTFTMTGGEITGNTPTTVVVAWGGTFMMSGGKITGNTALWCGNQNSRRNSRTLRYATFYGCSYDWSDIGRSYFCKITRPLFIAWNYLFSQQGRQFTCRRYKRFRARRYGCRNYCGRSRKRRKYCLKSQFRYSRSCRSCGRRGRK